MGNELIPYLFAEYFLYGQHNATCFGRYGELSEVDNQLVYQCKK